MIRRADPGLLLAAGALMMLPLTYVGSGPSATAATPVDSGSAVTQTGTGPRFGNLKVTVNQTTHLRNQVVEVSWSGGRETGEGANRFTSDYLQIMQCWGDETAPIPEKCQFGGLWDDQSGGSNTSTRVIENDGLLVDQAEDLTPPFGDIAIVPFVSATGKTEQTRRSEFFDTQTTNEIPYGRTAADGSGQEFFEIQTVKEAPGLGCGSRLESGPRACWLVVVPRDDIEVNGQNISDLAAHALQTSPLSTSNWKNAISFRLDFEPVGVACPIGEAERHLVGHEEVVEAVGRWQPALCSQKGLLFGYIQHGDAVARNQALSAKPWLSVVAEPIPPGLVLDRRTLAYAPLAVSGVGIAVIIERAPKIAAPPDVSARKGTRVLDVRLNARLVAKLLTQSYRNAVPGIANYLGENPLALSDDPEFVKLNPEFQHLQYFSKLYAITNPLGLADANRALWQWIAEDPKAQGFINGMPDPWGMRVNRHYRAMNLDRSDFPRSDPTCSSFPNSESNQADLCALQTLAYASDFHTAGRSAARGQTLATATWDATAGRYKLDPPQQSGKRALLAFVDTGTAARYQLPMARLENASGAFVAPSETSMTAALLGLQATDVAGVEQVDPQADIPTAYPLTSVSYAVTAPALLEKSDAEAYAAFLRYAVTQGQVPGQAAGQLPDGYVPLPPSLRAKALEAATLIATRGGPDDDPTDEPTDDPGEDPGDLPGTYPGTDPAAEPDDRPAPGKGGDPSAGPEVVTGDDLTPTASARTPETAVGAMRFVLVSALLLGLLFGLARPLTPLLLRRSRG